jgi:hypothetical protein
MLRVAAGRQADPSFDAMPPAAVSGGPQSEEPLYLSVIDLFVRVTFSYFAIVGVALVIDMVRGDRLTFRSWVSFALQSGAVFLLAAIVARRTLDKWQQGARQLVPANISSSAAIIGFALAAGTLAGGFFPDPVGYQRRAPEPFLRTMSALVPLAVAVYLVLRSAERNRPVAAVSPEPPLTGAARDAAVRALEILDRGEQALTEFQRVVSAAGISRADAEWLWVRLDGKGYVARLRQMPPEHAITRALRDAGVAQTDAVYLIALAHGAHDAMGHTAESAREFIAEVATRRGRPDADAETLAAVAHAESKKHRDAAAGLLQASRFSAPLTSE